MSIYLHYNDKQTGPFSVDQIRQMLQSGLVQTDALAWKEGMANWIPVQEMLGASGLAAGAMPVPPPAKKSALGWISLGISLVSIPAWITLLVIAGMATNKGTATPEFNAIVGAVFLLGVFLNFIAFVLGAIGAFTTRARTVPILGACLNGFMILALIGLIILGLAVKHQQ
jgi:hypothetical protein